MYGTLSRLKSALQNAPRRTAKRRNAASHWSRSRPGAFGPWLPWWPPAWQLQCRWPLPIGGHTSKQCHLSHLSAAFRGPSSSSSEYSCDHGASCSSRSSSLAAWLRVMLRQRRSRDRVSVVLLSDASG